MRKVLVIGSGGAGKSTLAIELGTILDLPVVHLDRLHWKPGWVEPDKETWRETVREVVAGDRWIIDGNYGGDLDLRVPHADTIIYLDFPPLVCVWRVLKRRFQYRKGGRPDMAPGCDERFDREFLKFVWWVWNYRRNSRPRILDAIARHGADKELIVLSKPRQVADFLNEASSRKVTVFAGP